MQWYRRYLGIPVDDARYLWLMEVCCDLWCDRREMEEWSMFTRHKSDPHITAPAAHQPDEERFHVIHSEQVQWEPFSAFPPAARLAVLVGDPTKPGPYLIRVKLPAGTKMLPHRHPEDRIYTVISGVFYIG